MQTGNSAQAWLTKLKQTEHWEQSSAKHHLLARTIVCLQNAGSTSFSYSLGVYTFPRFLLFLNDVKNNFVSQLQFFAKRHCLAFTSNTHRDTKKEAEEERYRAIKQRNSSDLLIASAPLFPDHIYIFCVNTSVWIAFFGSFVWNLWLYIHSAN